MSQAEPRLLLHGCETLCFSIQPTPLLRTELKLNICTNEDKMHSDLLISDARSSDQSMEEHSPASEAPSNSASYQVTGRDEAEVTMCICPVCGFSASSPRGQDEHMETAHGECHTGSSTRSSTANAERHSPAPDAFTSTTMGLRASSTPHQRSYPSQMQKPENRIHTDPQQSRPAFDCNSPVPSVAVVSPGLALHHATSLPYFPHELQSSNTQPNSTKFCDPMVLTDDITTAGKLSPNHDFTRSGLKARAYRGSLGRSTRTASTSKLMDSGDSSPSSLTNALFLQKVDSRRRYRCNICPATFPWHGDLTEHLRLAHGMQKTRESARSGKAGNFCCNYCKYVAKYQSELRRHMRLHWGVKPFACVFCPYRSAWKGDLKRHMESHHRERFSSESELIEIMSQFKNNAGTTVNGVPLSAKSVTDAYNFGSDFESEAADDGSYKPSESQGHSSGDVSLSGFPKGASSVDLDTATCAPSTLNTVKKTDNATENSLVCSVCSYKAQNQSKLHNHMAGHVNLKPFKCPICEHRSNYKWDVRKHLRSQHPMEADRPVVVLTGLNKPHDTRSDTPPLLNESPPESPMSLCIDLASKTPEQHGSIGAIPTQSPSVIAPNVTNPWPSQNSGLSEPDVEVIPIDLSVKEPSSAIQQSTAVSLNPETTIPSALFKQRLVSEANVIQHTVSSLVDANATTLGNPEAAGVGGLTACFPLTGFPTPSSQASHLCSLSQAPSVSGMPWTPGVGLDQTGMLPTPTSGSNTIGLILNLQQQLLMHGLLPTWPPRPISTVVTTTAQHPSRVPTTTVQTGDRIPVPMELCADSTEFTKNALSELVTAPDTSLREKKTPSEWSSTDTDPSEPVHSGQKLVGFCATEATDGVQDTTRRTRGRKSTSFYSRAGNGGSGGGSTAGGSLAGVKEEQWKRHQCSGCGHRSNWKWDINKHIKVAHPERTNITTVTLDLEEAKQTFGEYMNRLKLSRNRYMSDTTGGALSSSSGPGVGWPGATGGFASTGEGYYRPYKCSVCGHRSNWKWDVRKHIKQMHNSEAEVITLSLDEARRTIHQYKSCRRQQQTRLMENSNTVNNKDILIKTEPPSDSPQLEEPRTDRLLIDSEDKSSGSRKHDPDLPALDQEAGTRNPLTQNSNEPRRRGNKSCSATRIQSGYRLYYPCRQCGRQFRSYPTLFFHMRHKHHLGTNYLKSGSLAHPSIRFYYTVSRHHLGANGSSRLQRSKAWKDDVSWPQEQSSDVKTKTVHVADGTSSLANDLDVLAGCTPRSDHSPTELDGSAPNASMEPRYVARNVLQRDRVIRARRRTGSNVFSAKTTNRLLQIPSSLETVTGQENVTERENGDDQTVTVRILTDSLDKVLDILEGKPTMGVPDVVTEKRSTGIGGDEILSHIADLIEHRLSKSGKSTPFVTASSNLDMSTSSNEENQPMGNSEAKDINSTSDRSTCTFLHHPEVERRFLRLATLFRQQVEFQSSIKRDLTKGMPSMESSPFMDM